MATNLNEYYHTYRVSVQRDLPVDKFIEFTKDYFFTPHQLSYKDYIGKLRLSIEDLIKQNNEEGFFSAISVHKNTILGTLEKMVSLGILPSVDIVDHGAKFLSRTIGTIGDNRWIMPNCSIKNKNGCNIYIDELRLMNVNSYFSSEIIGMKLNNPDSKILLINGNLRTIPVHRLNYNIVLDWTAPLPYECLEDF